MGYSAVIHLAALSSDPLGMLDEQLTYDVNYKASVKLATLAKRAGISRFIFASSCSLYGQGSGHALTEESPSNPQTAYGKSKIYAEQEISKLADENFSPVFMRNATAFGIAPRMRFDIVVNNLTGFAKVDHEIKILGDGKPWRPLVHVKDICRAIIAILDAKKELIHNQSFNIGDNNENYQIKSIAKKVQDHFKKCHISIAQKDAGDSRDYNVSFNKVNKTLGFYSKWSLDRGLKEIKDVYKVVKLDNEKFNNRLYTRLKQINHLIRNKKIDLSLRRIQP
jgi:nucleoside-diphosphate-sugar epimerase